MSHFEEDSGSWSEKPVRHPSAPRSRIFTTVVVATVVAAVVTLGLHFVLVPSGVGWRHMVHEATVSVPGGQPFTVQYPSSFSKKPSLTFQVLDNDVWFYRIDEQTPEHFTITNTTVRRDDGTPMIMTLRWKAEGARW